MIYFEEESGSSFGVSSVVVDVVDTSAGFSSVVVSGFFSSGSTGGG